MGDRNPRPGMKRPPGSVLLTIMKNQIFPTLIFLLAAFVPIGSAHGGEMLNPGDAFPKFELTAHDDTIVRSTELEGTSYLIYYYPKADTPGCTKEACLLRDHWSELEEVGLKVFGVSYDKPKANAAFAEKYHLPFLLLSDVGHVLADQVGAARLLIPVPKRISYLVGSEGKIIKAYPSVTPSSHAAEVLKDYQGTKEH